MIERLDHLVLTVADIDTTVDFYQRVLGMRHERFGAALVSVRGSIHYIVLPGLYRDDVLARAELLESVPVAAQPADAAAWWRLAGVA